MVTTFDPNLFLDGEIPAVYASFGKVPYGKTLMGKLHFDTDNVLGCDEYGLDDKDEIDRSADVAPMYLAYRGSCTFVQKVRNMENLGVAVGILIDDAAEDVSRLTLADDGTGGGIRIPSMMISRTDGDVLVKWLKKATPAELRSLVVMAEFKMPVNNKNNVKVEYWMSSSSNRAMDFIEDFHPLLDDLRKENRVQFLPHYVFWECRGCDRTTLENDCYADGRYCAVEPSNEAILGREIILEDLRQKCLFTALQDTKRNTTDWSDYIDRVHSTCHTAINEDCSRAAHQHLGLDYDMTEACMKDSFSRKENQWGSGSCKNTIIDEEIAAWETLGSNTYPALMINDRAYRGQIEPLSVFNAICAAFADPPKKCWPTLGLYETQTPTYFTEEDVSGLVTSGEIFLSVLAVVAVNVLVVYCCRRRAKRELNHAMQTQIESQIGQYNALQMEAK